jgi:hypothetical protein
MAFGPGQTRLASARRDDAVDASRFFSRMGYAVLAIGAPVGVVVHPLALFIIFPIAVAMILMAAALEAKPAFLDRFLRPFQVPAFLALIAGLAWATLSVLWTPYPVSALQHSLKLALLILATLLAVAAPRDNARATDLYLFPIGVALGMAAMATKGLANILARAPDEGGLAAGAVALAVLLFPALGGLTARGRNGYARLLLILALGFAYVDGYAPLTIALFAGYLALSFSISDLSRTTRELAWAAAAMTLLSPLIPAFAPTVAAWVFHVKLANLPPPWTSLSVAADVFTHDKLRLVTGHGFETVARSVRGMILPAHTPKALAFTVWYELGVIGAVIAASGVWFAFRDLVKAPPRLAPFMAACLAAIRDRGLGRVVRLSRSRQSAAPARAVHGRLPGGDRGARVRRRRLRRYDDDDPDRGRNHCDRCGGAKPVPHDAPVCGQPREPVTLTLKTASLRRTSGKPNRPARARSALAGEGDCGTNRPRAFVLDDHGACPSRDQTRATARPSRLLGRKRLHVLHRHAHQRSRDLRALPWIVGKALGRDQRLFNGGAFATHTTHAPLCLPGGSHKPLQFDSVRFYTIYVALQQTNSRRREAVFDATLHFRRIMRQLVE